MNEENGSPKFRQNDELQFYRKTLWLFVGLLPGGMMLGFLGKGSDDLWLVGLAPILSVAASIGLVRGMRNKVWQCLLCLLLAFLFFALNALIALFIGCSSMGRIAP